MKQEAALDYTGQDKTQDMRLTPQDVAREVDYVERLQNMSTGEREAARVVRAAMEEAAQVEAERRARLGIALEKPRTFDERQEMLEIKRAMLAKHERELSQLLRLHGDKARHLPDPREVKAIGETINMLQNELHRARLDLDDAKRRRDGWRGVFSRFGGDMARLQDRVDALERSIAFNVKRLDDALSSEDARLVVSLRQAIADIRHDIENLEHGAQEKPIPIDEPVSLGDENRSRLRLVK